MPDQSSAADEHALLQEITAPLATLPDDAVRIAAEADFPVAFRGYDRLAVDAYVKKTSQLVAELQSTRSPEAAVRRALERVGEQVSGILKRAHETAEQITAQSRREAENRLVVARQEVAQIAAASEQRVKELDAETDRIWAERLRIVEDARELAAQLLALAEEAADRFPPAEQAPGQEGPHRQAAGLYDIEGDAEEDVVGASEADEGSLGPEGAAEEPEGKAEPARPEPAQPGTGRAAEPPPAGDEPEHEPDDPADPTAVHPPVEPADSPPAGPAEPPEASGPSGPSETPAPPDDPPRPV
jgi:uncharacterized protein with HEPN domain